MHNLSILFVLISTVKHTEYVVFFSDVWPKTGILPSDFGEIMYCTSDIYSRRKL